jgi:magnesium chelatase family protein
MLAAVRSAAVLGIDAYDVLVEVDVALGLPMWTIVGLPAGAVKESRERVSAALLNSGFVVPARRVTVNLAPGDQRKDGTAFDLPIALGYLAATGQLDAASLASVVAIGELGLDGSLRPVRGALSVARRLAASGRRNRDASATSRWCSRRLTSRRPRSSRSSPSRRRRHSRRSSRSSRRDGSIPRAPA